MWKALHLIWMMARQVQNFGGESAREKRMLNGMGFVSKGLLLGSAEAARRPLVVCEGPLAVRGRRLAQVYRVGSFVMCGMLAWAAGAARAQGVVVTEASHSVQAEALRIENVSFGPAEPLLAPAVYEPAAVPGGQPRARLPEAPSALVEASSSSAQDSPAPQTSTQAAPVGEQSESDQPSKRVLFIVPNYRSVRVGSRLPPQSVGQKFHTAFEDTVDPADFVLAAIVAGYSYGLSSTPEFGTGGVAYGRYYWHSLADQAIENMSVEFIVPTLTHEDTRFYTLGSGGFTKRAGYALTRVLVTRSDSGHPTVNLGELLGAGLAASVSSLYYPSKERTAGTVLGQYGLDIGIDAASYFLREFDSDLSHVLSRKHQVVKPSAQ